MNMIEKSDHAIEKCDQTNLYRAPTLKVYGAMAELTAGGSGPVTEVAAGNKSANNRA